MPRLGVESVQRPDALLHPSDCSLRLFRGELQVGAGGVLGIALQPIQRGLRGCHIGING